MDDSPVYKLEIFIPENYVETLRDELHRVNVGRIGNYDHCISYGAVHGYYRPLEGANPLVGEVGVISAVEECKVEVNCRRESVQQALEAIRRIHPYDEAVINIIPLANHLFES